MLFARRTAQEATVAIVLGWLVFAIVAGVIAAGRGRSGVGYFLLSIVLSPLVGILLAVALPDLKQAKAREADLADSRECPHCAELIKRAATVCRYCGRDLAPLPLNRASEMSAARTAIFIVLLVIAAFAAYTWLAPPSPTQPPGSNATRTESQSAPPSASTATSHPFWTRFKDTDGKSAASVRPELRARFMTPALRFKMQSQKASILATMLGRAAACGLPDSPEFGNQFGAWMNRTFVKDKTQTLALAAVMETAARSQRDGKSPDSCESVAKFFAQDGAFQQYIKTGG
jgi:hypothetical protein